MKIVNVKRMSSAESPIANRVPAELRELDAIIMRLKEKGVLVGVVLTDQGDIIKALKRHFTSSEELAQQLSTRLELAMLFNFGATLDSSEESLAAATRLLILSLAADRAQADYTDQLEKLREATGDLIVYDDPEAHMRATSEEHMKESHPEEYAEILRKRQAGLSRETTKEELKDTPTNGLKN